MGEPDFLSVADQFQLGMLDTERSHPKTRQLSKWAQKNLKKGYAALREVDADALSQLEERLDNLVPLAEAIRYTIQAGKRIFLCGCGATGRLSIALEIFARDGLLKKAKKTNVFGFMAGGDTALIRSVERFEDLPAYGERQLMELGFQDGDLLISSTEGGETPFVIGATEAAARKSKQKPFFLYCNPDDVLAKNVERSAKVLRNRKIRKINLAVGPMALSGSTRMQASTVLMAAIGFAMKHQTAEQLVADFLRWKRWVLDEIDWNQLIPFTEAEAAAYQAGDFLLYEPGGYGITVLTDTTERSPTFTLTPFERDGIEEPASLCYLRVPQAKNAREAWKLLLNRKPRPLEWGSLCHLTGAEAIYKFDFSAEIAKKRRARTGTVPKTFWITRKPKGIELRFGKNRTVIPVPKEIDSFGENLALKMLMNAHSTLLMGRLGRYEDNLMTYVSANNFKLIDRSARYVQSLLKRHHDYRPRYLTVVKQVLAEKEDLLPDEPIVLKTVDALLKRRVGKKRAN